jgi:hypothetical protein
MSTAALVPTPDKAMLWAPRLLAIAFSLFLGIFSLDAFETGATVAEALPAFLLHLIPWFAFRLWIPVCV